MKGFVYLDIDGNLVMKDYDYITTVNPHFWGMNSHLIVKHWEFDTEDPSSMRSLLLAFKHFPLPAHTVRPFLELINFDVNSLKANARKVQSGQE